MADNCIYCIVVYKTRYIVKFCSIVLILINNCFEVLYHDAILFFALAIQFYIKNYEMLLRNTINLVL